VQEVPTNFPEYWNMPETGDIDREEHKMTGYITGPTEDEVHRRLHLE
jgi:hypothetical protein